ncbi:hypothetical protein EDD15DRAFT_1808456 [Pisolithus albus]|nr:hypothetical protein EDD15DRAFT_1808456 [Pisolithus albus]
MGRARKGSAWLSIHQVAEALGERGHSLSSAATMPSGASQVDMDRVAHQLACSGHGTFITAPHPGLDLPPLTAALGERYGYAPLERTDRMIVGVKRGIDEMLAASQPQQSPSQASQQAQPLTSSPQPVWTLCYPHH